jgi:hypothetical protein
MELSKKGITQIRKVPLNKVCMFFLMHSDKVWNLFVMSAGIVSV